MVLPRALLLSLSTAVAVLGTTTDVGAAALSGSDRAPVVTAQAVAAPLPVAVLPTPAGRPATVVPPAPSVPVARAAAAAPKAAPRKAATTKAAPKKAAPKKAAPKKTAVRTTTTSRAGCDGTSGWRERRAAAAVSAVGLSPQDLGYRLVVRPAQRGLLGLADSGPRTITLYVRDCKALSPAGLAFVLAHELAHALDFSCADADRRAAWLAARGSRAPYWPTAGARDDLSSGAGDFAEAFAVARTGHRAMWASRLGKAPTAAQLSAWKHLLRPTC